MGTYDFSGLDNFNSQNGTNVYFYVTEEKSKESEQKKYKIGFESSSLWGIRRAFRRLIWGYSYDITEVCKGLKNANTEVQAKVHSYLTDKAGSKWKKEEEDYKTFIKKISSIAPGIASAHTDLKQEPSQRHDETQHTDTQKKPAWACPFSVSPYPHEITRPATKEPDISAATSYALKPMDPLSLKIFRENIKTLEQIAADGKFEELESLIRGVIKQLEKRAIPPQDAASWIALLRDLGFLVVRASFGQERRALFPESIREMLQLLQWQDQLIRSSDPSGVFAKNYVLDIEDAVNTHGILQDPYFSAGDELGAISNAVEYFQNIGAHKILICGNATTNRATFCQQVRTFPPEFLCMEQLYTIFRAAVAPSKMLKSTDGTEALDLTTSISRKCCSPITIQETGTGEFTIEPWKCTYIDAKQPPINIQSDFATSGVMVSKEFRVLFEQVVAKRVNPSENYRYDREGEEVAVTGLGQRSKRWLFQAYKGKTEFQILNSPPLGGIPSDVWQSIQLIKTGESSRVANTLSWIGANLAALDNEQYGATLGRVIENGLLSQTSIYKNEEAFTQCCHALKTAMESICDLSTGTIQKPRTWLFLFELYRCVVEGGTKRNMASVQSQQEALNPYLALLSSWVTDLKKGAQRPCMQLCCREFLLSFPLNKDNKDRWENYLFATEFLRQYAPHEQDRDPVRELRLKAIREQCDPQLAEELKRNTPLKNAVCSAAVRQRLKQTVQGNWDPSLRPLSFTNGSCTVDLASSSIRLDGKELTIFPSELMTAPSFTKLRSLMEQEGVTDVPSQVWRVETTTLSWKDKTVSATEYTMPITNPEWKLVTVDREVFLYRNRGNTWFRYVPEIHPGSSLKQKGDEIFPRVLCSYDCWICEDARRLEARKEGTLTFQAELSDTKPLKIVNLVRENAPVAPISTAANHELLTRLEDPSHILAMDQPLRVEYDRMNLTYTWNEKLHRWDCATYKGYYLSEKTFAQITNPQPKEIDEGVVDVQTWPLLSQLFPREFTRYHILEHDNEPPRMVLPKLQYPQITGMDIKEAEVTQAYTFTLDPTRGLIAQQQPDGYFYLAYCLAAQKKYDQALTYLRKADLNRPFSKDAEEILKWIFSLQDRSHKLVALKARIALIKNRTAVMTSRASSSGSEDELRTESFAIAQSYWNLLKNEHAIQEIGSLALTVKEFRELRRYGEATLRQLSGFYFHNKSIANEETAETMRMLASLDTQSNKKWADIANSKEGEAIERLILRPLNIGWKTLLNWHKTKVFSSLDAAYQTYEKTILMFGGNKDLIQLNIPDREGFYFDLMRAGLQRMDFSVQQWHEREITKLQKRLPPLVDTSKKTVPQSQKTSHLFSGTFQHAKFDPIEAVTGVQAITEEEIRNNKTTCTRGESPYADDLLVGLYDDTLTYLSRQTGDRHPAAFDQKEKELFSQELERLRTQTEQAARQQQVEIVQKLKRALAEKKFPSTDESLFQTCLRSYGEGDWSIFGNIPAQDKADIEKNIALFLQTSIQAQQLAKARSLLHEMNFDNTESLLLKSQELATILDLSWQYDPNDLADPHARTILLLEFELGIVARSSQIKVIRECLSEENIFRQEICGGGKTTVIRNVLTHAMANGARLSGVSTLHPLRGEHGPLFARTTTNAFGQIVFEFHFDEKSRTDEMSLLILHHTLLRMILDRGRIDLSKGDLQSFKLSMSQKQEKIDQCSKQLAIIKKLLKKAKEEGDAKAEKRLQEAMTACTRDRYHLHREYGRMEEIRDLFLSRATIISDEIDQDSMPTEEKNRAQGALLPLPEEEKKATLFIGEAILTSVTLENLRKAIQSNTQNTFSENIQNVAGAQKALAEELYEKCRAFGLSPDLGKEEVIAYLTDPASELFEQKLKERVKDTPMIRVLCFSRRLISDVLPDAIRAKGGVSYGRDPQGCSVIPFSASDRPKIGSEHMYSCERLLYTLFEYMDKSRGQFSPEEVRRLVVTPLMSLSYEKADQEAQSIYHMKISEIETPAGLQRLAEKINKDNELFITCLQKVFDTYRQSKEKMVSDSQDPSSMVRNCSGSSGTDAACHALPDKIDSSGARQPGVHGEIIYNLLRIEKKLGASSFIRAQAKTIPDLVEAISCQMSGGDCLSDVGRLFPGVSSLDIAKHLQSAYKKRPPKPIPYICFFTNDDRPKMLCPDGRTMDADFERIPCKDVITIFDDSHTRGAERKSCDGVTEFVTLDVDTDWTRFEQGVMRERGVVKGKADVRYILSPALSQKLAQDDLSIHDVIAMCTTNEATRLQKLNLKAERARIQHILKYALESAERAMSKDDRFTNQPDHPLWECREKVRAFARSFFIEKNITDDVEAAMQAGPSKKQEAVSQSLDDLIEKQLNALDGIVNKVKQEQKEAQAEAKQYYQKYLDEVESARLRLIAKLSTKKKEAYTVPEGALKDKKPRLEEKYMPSKVSEASTILGNEQTQEQEVQEEQQMEQEMSVQKGDVLPAPYQDLGLYHKKPQELLLQLIPCLNETTMKAELAAIEKRILELKAELQKPNLTEIRVTGISRTIAAQNAKIVEKKAILADRAAGRVNNYYLLRDFASYHPKYKFISENFSPIQRIGTVRPWGPLHGGEGPQPPILRSLFVIDPQQEADVAVAEIIGSSTELDRWSKYVQENRGQQVLSTVYNYGTGSLEPDLLSAIKKPEIARRMIEYIVTTKIQSGCVDFRSRPLKNGESATVKQIFDDEYGALVLFLNTLDAQSKSDLYEGCVKMIRTFRPSLQFKGSDLERAFKEAGTSTS